MTDRFSRLAPLALLLSIACADELPTAAGDALPGKLATVAWEGGRPALYVQRRGRDDGGAAPHHVPALR